MVLKVIASGSKGNCYVLDNGKEALVLEAGVPLKKVKKCVGFDITRIVGLVVTHKHQDHDEYSDDYSVNGIPVFRPFAMTQEEAVATMFFGGFKVRAFDLVHDVPCFGFYITHEEIGKMVYITDTAYCKYRFRDLSQILIEANYDKTMIDRSFANSEHVIGGHMEIGTTLKFIEKNKSENLRNVVFCHLSQVNSSDEYFIEEAQKIVSCGVFRADRGMEINFNK